MIDGRLARGERTRVAVLDAAVSMASVDGLEAMSLARLAQATQVSKSGLFAHWPDKEALQLAVVAHAVHMWVEHVVTPAFGAPRGLRRLWALHERRMEFYAKGVLVRDALAAAITAWLAQLETVAAQAVELGELRADADPGQLAFEIEAHGHAAITFSRLLHAERATAYARTAVLDRLRSLSPLPELLPEK